MRVSVCVTTCDRPEGLKRLLEGLDRLEFNKTRPKWVGVAVIDNDPAGRGLELCREMGPGLKWPLEFKAEHKRGFSYARNAAVALARGRSDFIAFIDDDETPEPSWLDELLHVQGAYGADVVAGPVLPRYESESPPWVAKGGFFERERHGTGQGMDAARTGNVLMAVRLFSEARLSFAERYALTGGEDTDFFMRAARAGYKIVWADGAVVHEWVPRDRMTALWLLRRAYRSGRTYNICALDLDRSRAFALERACKGALRIAEGALTLPPSLLMGRHAAVKALQKICAGTGGIAALFLANAVNNKEAGAK